MSGKGKLSRHGPVDDQARAQAGCWSSSGTAACTRSCALVCGRSHDARRRVLARGRALAQIRDNRGEGIHAAVLPSPSKGDHQAGVRSAAPTQTARRRGRAVAWVGVWVKPTEWHLQSKQSRRPESNWRPPHYECGALPTELRRRAKTVTIEGAKCSRIVPFFQKPYKRVAAQRLTLIPARPVTDDRLARLHVDGRIATRTPLARRAETVAGPGARVQGIPARSVPKVNLPEKAGDGR